MGNQLVSFKARYSNLQKKEILSEHLDKGISLSVVARKHGIHPVTLSTWKRKMRDNSVEIDLKSILEENKRLQKENKKLKSALGESVIHGKDLEEINEFLKKKWMSQQLKLQENLKVKRKSPLRR